MIIGGGLAGLTLGIGLRLRGVPVTIWEAGHYPRHRVCGEFISGQGQEALKRLELLELFEQAEAKQARTAAFFLNQARAAMQTVSPPALSLSRYIMDDLLAKHFRQAGGTLHERTRWTKSMCDEGVVCASGRRVRPVEDGWRWFGMKVHASNVDLLADLEMHSVKNGYVGICRLEPNRVNICGLFRRPASDHNPTASWQTQLRGQPDTTLYQRLHQATFISDSFCAVAGLPLRPQHASDFSECRIGDALTMIPPITGNGMSMAFEAAELAIEPLLQYSQGEICWEEAKRSVAHACDRTFAQRLTWARWLQWAMFTPAFQGRLGRLLFNCEWLWRFVLNRTR
ncbi:MAG TPA: FAD-dependent monooxygenase [Clostridia bacterium]|nr:FAD-dependent monooxygenase [Clostridia bacterium]